MTRKNVIKFPGNTREAFRRAQSASVIVLPVIRIERFGDDESEKLKARISRRAKRIMNLRTMRRE